MKPQSFGELAPKVVLGIAAHPDDLDFGAGGTLAAFAQMGAEVHYLQLTDGCKGSADPTMSCEEIAKLRQQEQRAACDVIGGTAVHFLDHVDGELEVTMELKAEIVKVIRTLKPDVVITIDPSVLYDTEYGIINHSDHRAAGQATLDAVYPLARDHLAFPEQLSQDCQPHKVATVLLINFSEQNYFVDITNTLETKLMAMQAHASQMHDSTTTMNMFTLMAKNLGSKAGHQYVEGFIRIDMSL